MRKHVGRTTAGSHITVILGEKKSIQSQERCGRDRCGELRESFPSFAERSSGAINHISARREDPTLSIYFSLDEIFNNIFEAEGAPVAED